MAATTATDGTNRTSSDPSVIVAGARTPMGRLLGSLKGFSGAELGGPGDQGRAQPGRRGARPGRLRDHGPGPTGRRRPDHRTSGCRQGRHPDDRSRDHDQQGLPLRPGCHRARRPADPRRRVRDRRGRRHGVDDPGAAPAAEEPRGLQVRRRARCSTRWRTTGCSARSTSARWASPPSGTTPSSGISREEQDAFSAQSHQRAAEAAKNGLLRRRDRAGRGAAAQGRPAVFATDEGVRADTTADLLGKLRPAFAADGTITAGSSSQISDGGAAVVVMSKSQGRGARPRLAGRDRRTRCRRRPRREPAVAAGQRHQGGAGQGAASRSADLDLVEINEAFASVAIQSMKELGLDGSNVNVNGGAIAMGHPIGMSGARLVLHLALELRRRGGGTGAAALCGGGGQGDALRPARPRLRPEPERRASSGPRDVADAGRTGP